MLNAFDFECRVLLPPSQYKSINFLDIGKSYALVKAFLPDLHDQLSENLRIMIQAYSLYSLFMSPVRKSYKETADKVLAGTVFAWEQGDREAFIHLGNCLAQECPEVDLEFLNHQVRDNNPDFLLFEEYLAIRFDPSKLAQVIDNQMISKKP